MTALFPLIKRFNDINKKKSSAILKEESFFYDKSFRKGTVFIVIGWREIKNSPYIIISKGSWEGLIPYTVFLEKMEKIQNFVVIFHYNKSN